MMISKRALPALVAALILLMGVAAGTVHAQQPQAGKDFMELSTQQPVDSNGKVEVIEFFWYGCPHCHNLEEPLKAWVKKRSGDIVFRRVPAMFNENWAMAGRIYYTLEALGQLDRLHAPFFDAIHKDGLRYTNQSQFEAWLGKQGVDAEKFKTTAKSFAVESKVRRAVQLTNAYRFESVPTLAVHGRYIVGAGQGPAHQLAVADHVVELAQKQILAEKK